MFPKQSHRPKYANDKFDIWSTRAVFTVQERHLESEEELFGLGFNPLNSEYYHVSNQGDELPWDSNLANEFTFYMHPDVVYQKRAVFTFFDALGDIGGLRDIFTVVG